MAMIDRNFTFATNGTVSAADLHNLIDSATIYQDLITGQVPITSVGTNYELLIADGTNPNAAPNAVTVYDLFDDALSVGTYTGLNLTGALTYGTATGTRLVSANATITTGTITTGVIPTLTAGTTTSTAATITSGTITNLASTTGTIATLNSTTGTIATLNSTTGTIATLNSTTGTITNLSTTLAGDFTISQGTGTLGTSGVTAGAYGSSTIIPTFSVDAKGRITTVSTASVTASVSGTVVGSIIAWTTGTAPSDYLHCDGSAINRTTYAGLFGVISTSYGTGDGSTTFNIPDYRGRFLRGFANGQSTDPDRATRTNRGDGTTGDNVGTNQADEFKGHNHSATTTARNIATGGAGNLASGGGSPNTAGSVTIGTSGGNETRPINTYVMWCIKF
jgi:microcystin-dependent protein